MMPSENGKHHLYQLLHWAVCQILRWDLPSWWLCHCFYSFQRVWFANLSTICVNLNKINEKAYCTLLYTFILSIIITALLLLDNIPDVVRQTNGYDISSYDMTIDQRLNADYLFLLAQALSFNSWHCSEMQRHQQHLYYPCQRGTQCWTDHHLIAANVIWQWRQSSKNLTKECTGTTFKSIAKS